MCLRLKGKQSAGEQSNSTCQPDPVAVTKGSWGVHHFPALPPISAAGVEGGPESH